MGIFKKKTDREKLNKLIEKRKKLKKKKEVKESKNKKTKIVDKKIEKNQSKINKNKAAKKDRSDYKKATTLKEVVVKPKKKIDGLKKGYRKGRIRERG